MEPDDLPEDVGVACFYSALFVILGVTAQAALLPGQPAWGFYEQISFALVGIIWLVFATGRAIRWWRSDE